MRPAGLTAFHDAPWGLTGNDQETAVCGRGSQAHVRSRTRSSCRTVPTPVDRRHNSSPYALARSYFVNRATISPIRDSLVSGGANMSEGTPNPQINFSKIQSAGGVAGAMVAVMSTLIFLLGIPLLRYFLPAAIVLGGAVALFIRFKRHETPGKPWILVSE